MADSNIFARFGHRTGVYMKNDTSGSTIWVDRVQRVDSPIALRTSSFYELGAVGKTGVVQDPAEMTLVIEKNLVNCELDYLLTGQDFAPAGTQTWNLGQLLGKTQTGYIIHRNDSDTIDAEIQVDSLRVSSYEARFTIRDAIMETWTMNGITGQWYTSGFPHGTWGTADTTSVGGVHGKEARIWFTSGSAAATRLFRAQSFNIRAGFPVTPVGELGRRNLVGQMSDSPDVTLDFDVLLADYQPLDKLFATTGSGYDLNTTSALFNGFVRVFDPDVSEAGSVIKMYKLENLKVTGATPTRSQVRGLSTMRFSLTVAKEATAGTGGLIVSNKNSLT